MKKSLLFYLSLLFSHDIAISPPKHLIRFEYETQKLEHLIPAGNHLIHRTLTNGFLSHLLVEEIYYISRRVDGWWRDEDMVGGVERWKGWPAGSQREAYANTGSTIAMWDVLHHHIWSGKLAFIYGITANSGHLNRTFLLLADMNQYNR